MQVHITIEEQQARFLRCIGEPTRLQILKLLAGGEKCVSEIVGILNKEQSLISHHLRALKECYIVATRQQAQKTYYRLADHRLAELLFKSESLTKELPICQSREECYESEENQGSGQSQVFTNSQE